MIRTFEIKMETLIEQAVQQHKFIKDTEEISKAPVDKKEFYETVGEIKGLNSALYYLTGNNFINPRELTKLKIWGRCHTTNIDGQQKDFGIKGGNNNEED